MYSLREIYLVKESVEMKLKTETLLIRLSPDDKEFVKKVAEKEGLNMSTFVLMLVKNYKLNKK